MSTNTPIKLNLSREALYGIAAGVLIALGTMLIPLSYVVGDIVGGLVWFFMPIIPLLWIAGIVLGVLALVRYSDPKAE